MEAPTGCDEVERELFVTPTQFGHQMADLARRGLRSVRQDKAGASPDRSVLITFDDAYAHVASAVTPILSEYGFSAVMFCPAAYLGGRNEWDTGKHPRLASLDIATRAQIGSMAEGPWEIASHGWRHVDLRTLPQDERLSELQRARTQLSELAGTEVETLAYPFGYSNRAVREDARKAGYRQAFRVGPGPSGDPYQLPRHQVNGGDSLAVFRLKTSLWLDRLYRVQRLTPGWARTGARAAVASLAQR